MRQRFRLHIYWLLMFAITIGYADVKKQTKSEVSIGPIGSMVITELVQIKGNKMYNQSLSEMKGSGMLGFAMQSMGATTNEITITDLDKKVTYILDMNKKTYREIPFDTYKTMIQGWKQTMEQSQQHMQTEERSEKPTHKVIRNEFRISKTGERKTIAGFTAQKYNLLWVMEIQNTETGERMIDSLVGEIWTADDTRMKKMRQEEMAFYEKYAKAMGLPTNPYDEQLLGLSYLRSMGKMQGANQPQMDVTDNVSRELRKISGYPVQIETNMFVFNPDKPQETQQQETSESQEPDLQQAMKQLQQLGGLFGRKKKSPKPKPKPAAPSGPVPAFTYRYHIVKVEFTPVEAKMFTIPSGFRKVEDGM